MLRIEASKLANKSYAELDHVLTGSFILVCEDGEVEVTTRDVLLSQYIWKMDVTYNQGRIKKDRLISNIIGNGRISHGTINAMLARVIKDLDRNNRGAMTEDQRIVRLYQMTQTAFQIVNLIYNEMSLETEEDVGTMNILDFKEVLDHPDIDAAYQNLKPTQESGDELYRVIKRVLKDPTKGLHHNSISKLSRSNLVSEKQIEQCLGPRMYVTDYDSMLFSTIPVMRGYTDGIRLFRDSLIESRSASKSLMLAKADLQDAEYFSRRLQLLVQSVENLHRTDCGSKDYVLWHVRPRKELDGTVYHPGDFKNLLGVNYFDDDGNTQTITEKDTHLIGKTIKMRNVVTCTHIDPKGVCSACYGALADSISPNSNLGHINTVWVTQKSSQSVLSVKHLDGSSVIERILLEAHTAKYLGVGEDGNTYTLLSSLKAMNPRIIVPHQHARNITDVDEVEDIARLTPRHVSEMDGVTLAYDVKTHAGVEERMVGLKVWVRPRLASFTHDMLAYIKTQRWEILPNGDFSINMTNWDFTKSFLELPLRHFNMSDHSKDIARLIESRKEKSMEREKLITSHQHLVEVFDLVNTKLNVNIAPLSVIVFGSMIRSGSKLDHALPCPPHAPGVLGVSSSTMLFRSLSVTMAFQDHHTAITSPYSFLVKNRDDHVFDAIICPREVEFYGTRTMPPWR